MAASVEAVGIEAVAEPAEVQVEPVDDIGAQIGGGAVESESEPEAEAESGAELGAGAEIETASASEAASEIESELGAELDIESEPESGAELEAAPAAVYLPYSERLLSHRI